PKTVKLQRQLDLRYPFQGYELTVDVPNRSLEESDRAEIRGRFDNMHNEVYGTHASSEVPDIVNVRAMSLAEVAKLDLPELPPQTGASREAAGRKVLFGEGEGYIDTPIFDRAALGAGAEIAGPAIIEQLDSTTVIMPGQTARVERYGNIIIDI